MRCDRDVVIRRCRTVRDVASGLGPVAGLCLLALIAGSARAQLGAPAQTTLGGAGQATLGGQAAQNAPKISEIVVLGNKVLNSDSIVTMSGLNLGEVATQQVLENARIALVRTGNFGANDVANPDNAVRVRITDVNPVTNQGKVVIEVDENDVVRGFNITGSGPIPVADLQKQIQTRVGFVLNTNTLAADVERIQKYYDTKGYVATIAPEGLTLTNGILDIPIVVGKIGKIDVVGIHKTRPYVVRRELDLKPGSYYNRVTLNRDYTRLFNTGLFDDIKSDISTPEPGTVNLRLDVTEKRSGNVGLSVGYSTLEGVIGRAEIGDNNFLGRGDQINFMVERSGFINRTSYELSFTEPWVDRKRTALSVSLYDRVIYRFGVNLGTDLGSITPQGSASQYYELHQGAQVTLSRPINPRLRGYVGLRYDQVSVPLLGQLSLTDAAILQNGSIEVGTLRATLNTRDYDQDPAAGGYYTATTDQGHANVRPVAPGSAGVFGKLNYGKYYVDLRRYFSPKGPRHNPKDKRDVLALRLMAGASSGYLPFSEQFFIGGADTVRGYDEQRFWGTTMLMGSVEFRHPLANSLTGVVFLDVGDAWGGSYEQVAFNGYTQTSHFYPYLGVGPGLRVVTPVGAIRIDEGYGRFGFRTHFGIGYVF